MPANKQPRNWVLKFPDGQYVQKMVASDTMSGLVRQTPNLDEAQRFNRKRAHCWVQRHTFVDENENEVTLIPELIGADDGQQDGNSS